MKVKTGLRLLEGTWMAAGIAVGICASKIYMIAKLSKIDKEALNVMREAMPKISKDDPDYKEKIKAISTNDFLDMSEKFNRALGRADLAEELLDKM